MQSRKALKTHRIALGILLFWILFSIIGPLLAPWGFYDSENIIVEEIDGVKTYQISPMAPSIRHPLGTDTAGYDFLTSLLYGSRYTIFLTLTCALLRTGIGFLIGSSQALYQEKSGKTRGEKTKLASGKFSFIGGLPVFVIIYFIQFGFVINSELSPFAMSMIQGFLIVVFGFSTSSPFFRDRTVILLEKPFIEAAFSSGGSKLWVFRYHIIPHLFEDMYISISQEIIAVLTLLGQLGIFSIFIGGTRFTPAPPELTSITREWGGLIGNNMGKLGTSYWWLIMIPIAAFLILYFSAFFVSRLLEKEVHKTYHMTSYL
ncbi:MAG: ABC transporter permease subunit [Bacteroidetes bacterium]|nr:ABC transporter permease subunit [Bacteroidota bacterium]